MFSVSLIKSWIFGQAFLQNIWKCYMLTPVCHNTHVNWLKCCHVPTLNHWWSHMKCYLEDSFIRNCLINLLSLYKEREQISSSFSLNIWCRWWTVGVALNVQGELSVCQQRKALYMSFSLNTLCRWLTIIDSTLCAGFSTDGTTLCCRHVANSWKSTLKNLHVVNTCPQWCRWEWLLQWIVSPVLKIPDITWKITSKMHFFNMLKELQI